MPKFNRRDKTPVKPQDPEPNERDQAICLGECERPVTATEDGVQCDECQQWVHYDCASRHHNIPGIPQKFRAKANVLPNVPYCCFHCDSEAPHLIQQMVNGGVFTVAAAENEGWSMHLEVAKNAGDQSQVMQSTSSQFVSVQASDPGNFDKFMQFLIQDRQMREAKEERDRQEREQERQLREEREERNRREDQKRFELLIQRLSMTPTAAATSSQSDSTTTGNNGQHTVTTVKLPKYQLPTFSGNVVEWTTFWDHFRSAVHENLNVTPEVKMHHLTASLKGKALNVVKGLPISAANYEIAVGFLKRRFGQEQDIIHQLENMVLTLPIIRSDDSNLEEFQTELEISLTRLESYNKVTNHLYSVIYGKMHKRLLELFDNQMFLMKVATPNLQNLRTFLETQVVQKLRHQQIFSSKVSTNKTFTNPVLPNTQPNREPKIVKDRKEIPPNFSCPFCESKGDHWPFFCQKVTGLQTRLAKINQSKRCHCCLRVKENAHFCRGRPCSLCMEAHHGSLCPKKVNQNEAKPQEKQGPSGKVPTQQLGLVSESGTTITNPQVHMLVTKGFIGQSKGKEEFEVNIFLDTGSKSSYILSNIAANIGAPRLSRNCRISVAHFGSREIETQKSKRVGFSLLTSDGSSITLSANTVETITAPLVASPLELSDEIMVGLQGRPVENLTSEIPVSYTIGLLIGADHFNEIVFASEGLSARISLYHTLLGDLLFGGDSEVDNLLSSFSVTSPALFTNSLQSPDGVMSQMWELEQLGINDDPETTDDEAAIQQFRSSIELLHGRYYVNWPWRNLSEPLPQNYYLARERLKRFHAAKLLHNTPLLKMYDDTIMDQLIKGVIEKVPDEEVINPKFETHYIPHHAVIKEGSNTTKLRVVYDASAKTGHGTSLNQHLLRGPVLLADLVAFLLRFRTWRYVMISDIEKAFLQVGLHQSQRDVCRFIWLKNPTVPFSEDNQQIYRFCRVSFGMISSPFLLAATIQFHLDSDDSPTAQAVKENVYVDNVFFGTETESEAVEFYKTAKQLFLKASMNLREWTTNCPQLNEFLPQSDKGSTSSAKVLGLKWDAESDVIKIPGGTVSPPEKMTKRSLLHGMAKVFDPLGLLSPAVLLAKLLFQSLWSKKLDWDADIPEDLRTTWNEAFANLAEIDNFWQSRLLLPTPIKNPELICFTDSSKKAYGACVYLKDGEQTALLCSKSRVCPLKIVSLPRLELLAILIGVRLLKFLKNQLRLLFWSVHVFSDSQIALTWVSSSQQRSVFVENRLSEIRKETDVVYHYVNTTENPADLTTKGCSVSNLNKFWWGGPTWLKNNSNTWTIWEMNEDNTAEIPKTMAKKIQSKSAEKNPVKESCLASSVPSVVVPFGLNFQAFSSLRKLLTRTAFLLRATFNFKNPRSKRVAPLGVLESEEISEARHFLEKFVQQSSFGEHFKTENELLHSDLVKGLRLFVDGDGLIRSHGRLAHSSLPDDANYPVLLPKNHPFTKLVIMDTHHHLLHAGPNQVLSQLRLRYWIPSGRSQVVSVLRGCLNCRRSEGSAFRPPPLPPLPSARVNQCPAFSQIGVDLVGPLFLSNNQKVYVYIFVCMTTRGVHLGLTPNKDSEQFVQAFSRFCSRRSFPQMILSDNAPHFRMVRRFFFSIVKRQEDPQKLLYKDCFAGPPKWEFIPPAAPWMGGFYERLVGILQRSIRINLGRSTLNWHQLHTFVTAVEGIMNTRPLTFVGSDIRDGRPLTPADLIAPSSRLMEIPDGNPSAPMSLKTAADLNDMWKRTQNHLNNFWNQWSQEYLLNLRSYNLRLPRSFGKRNRRNCHRQG